MITKIILKPKENNIKASDEFAFKIEEGAFAALREQGLISQAQYEECIGICSRKHKKCGDGFEL